MNDGQQLWGQVRDQVSSEGMRNIGSGHNLVGSVLCDSRWSKMLLETKCSKWEGDGALEGKEILPSSKRC